MKKILIFPLFLVYTAASPLILKEDGLLHKTGGKLVNANERIVHKTDDALHNAGEAIHDGSKKVVHKTDEIVRNTGEAFKEGGERVADKTGETLRNAGEAVHEGSEKMVKKTEEAVEKVEEDVKKTGEQIVEKGGKIIKGEEPIVDLNVNTRVKVLHSEVGVEGEVKIGFGHQTGAHASADASILGQKTKVHADILNSPEKVRVPGLS